MYNRYIPQPDGSYQRNRIPDQTPRHPEPVPPTPAAPPKPAPIPPPRPQPVHRRMPPKHQPAHESTSVGNFLKQLLPKHFETEDLLIVLLLLLMSGDCREEQNTALLTLMLYLFM